MYTSLTLTDLTDRDFLLAIEETADTEGWATSKEVADQIGIDNRHPAQCVGSRLGWLKRFKIPLETKVEKGEQFWKLTPEAITFLHPKKMTMAAQRAFESMDESQRVVATETLAREAARGSVAAAHLSRRGWNHSMAEWRDPDMNGSKSKKRSKSRV